MSAEKLRAAFREQAVSCAELGSPFTARICAVAAAFIDESNAIGRKMLGWPGDPRSGFDSVPLRFAAALHGLVIEGKDDALAVIYPPNPAPASDPEFWENIQRAAKTNTEFMLARLENAPQTNEVRRSVALFSGLACVAEEFGLPIMLSELGASAGLNLFCDRFGYRFAGQYFGNADAQFRLEPEWKGALPAHNEVIVVERQGCDLNPLDVRSPEDMFRLQSYLWPDQPERIDRTNRAIAIAAGLAAETGRSIVERRDAADFLEQRLARQIPGATHVVQHSIAFQYFPSEVQQRCRQSIQTAGERATRAAPLAWLAMEADGASPGAALTLQTWPGGRRRQLARVDFHGRWVEWLV